LSKLICFVSLFCCWQASADSLTLHLFRSPRGINWSSPWAMTTSTIHNAYTSTGSMRAFSISHVFVEVTCDSTGEHILRGQTSRDNEEERELIFKKKYGLGVMFHTFRGRFEKDDDIDRDMAPYEGSSRRATFSARINPQTCQRLLQYAREYEERGFGELYSGLQADPLKGEGAGCSAFAMSFIRVGGLLEPYMEDWKQIIDVPKRFVGGPITGNKVKITKILSHPRARWSNREPHVHLEAWDPERMHAWVGKIYDRIILGQHKNSYEFSVNRTGNSYAVEVDLTDKATPTGPIWLF
jgi:hypothetical protein